MILVGDDGATPPDGDFRETAERGDEVFGQTVGEVFVPATDRQQWQYRDLLAPHR
jgi:hypothetical protein